MNFEKETNKDTKRKIKIGIKIGLLLLFYILFYFSISFYSASSRNVTIYEMHFIDVEKAQAHNQKLEIYFGDNISALKINQLLSTINELNTNNTNEEFGKIGVAFKYKISHDEYGYLPINDLKEEINQNTMKYTSDYYSKLKYTTNLNKILTLIKSSSTYKVEVPGVKGYDLNKYGNDGFNEENGTVTSYTQAYYTNYYIRLIYIEEN